MTELSGIPMQVDEGARKLGTVTNNRPKLNVHAMTYITQGHTACMCSIQGVQGHAPQENFVLGPKFLCSAILASRTNFQ